MKKLLFLLVFIPLMSFGQNSKGVQMCLALQSNGFISNLEAEEALDLIMDVSGLNKNFILAPCDNIENAYAIRYNNERYIVYDKDFMDAIDGDSKWRNLTILAHEVAHHLNNHPLEVKLYNPTDRKSFAEKRRQELEADEFAGFIMARLDGPLKEVLAAISSISNDKDDTYSTHPSRDKRINAIKKGYERAGYKDNFLLSTCDKLKEWIFGESENQIEKPEEPLEPEEPVIFKYSVQELYSLASWLNDRTDTGLGPYSYNKFNLELNKREQKASKNPYSSGLRADVASIKLYLGDFEGAMNDMNKAFSLANKPSDNSSYGAINYELSQRALIKYMLGDYQGAINDINQYSEGFDLLIDNKTVATGGLESFSTFFWRGVFQLALNDLNNACKNLNKAINDNGKGSKYFREKIKNEAYNLLTKFCYN